MRAFVDIIILIAVSPLRDFLWTSTTGGFSAIRFIVFLYAAVCISIDDTTSPQQEAKAPMRKRSRLLTDFLYPSAVFRIFKSSLWSTRVGEVHRSMSMANMVSSPNRNADLTSVAPGLAFIILKRGSLRYACLPHAGRSDASDMQNRRQRLRCGDGGKSVDEQPSPSNDQALSSNPTPTSPPYYEDAASHSALLSLQ